MAVSPVPFARVVTVSETPGDILVVNYFAPISQGVGCPPGFVIEPRASIPSIGVHSCVPHQGVKVNETMLADWADELIQSNVATHVSY